MIIAVVVILLLTLLLVISGGYIIFIKKKLGILEKELEIQDSKLSYEKDRFIDSSNYFFSALIIIMEMMNQIDNVLKSSKDNLEEEILKILFDRAKTLFNPEKAILFRFDQNKNLLVPFVFFGYDDKAVGNASFTPDANKSFVGWSIATQRFLSYYDAQNDPTLSHLINTDPFGTYYSLPLKAENKTKAVVCLGQIRQQLEQQTIMRLFSFLSNIASIALNNAMLTQRLRELAIRDGLSGLYNHTYFQKSLDDYLRQTSGVFCIAMVDLDNFKKINDLCGHLAGDIVIKRISQIFNNIQVPKYLCARYGGDEFAFIFPDTDANGAFSILEKLRQEVAAEKFNFENQQRNVTISAGIKEVRLTKSENFDKSDLIKVADEALYKAKAEGKNKLVIAA